MNVLSYFPRGVNLVAAFLWFYSVHSNAVGLVFLFSLFTVGMKVLEQKTISAIFRLKYNDYRLLTESSLLFIDEVFDVSYGMEVLLFERFADIFPFLHMYLPALLSSAYQLYFKPKRELHRPHHPAYQE